jgi:hypothetical protein
MVGLSKETLDRFREEVDALREEMEEADFSNVLRGPWSELEATWHACRWSWPWRGDRDGRDNSVSRSMSRTEGVRPVLGCHGAEGRSLGSLHGSRHLGGTRRKVTP